MHSVRAFCPLPDVLRHVGRFVSENHGGEIKHNWQNPEDHKWYHHLHERLLYESDWSKTPQQGFVPNLSVSKPSVASGLIHPNGKEAGMFRILQRQGIGLYTDVKVVESLDELVEVTERDVFAGKNLVDAINKALIYPSGAGKAEVKDRSYAQQIEDFIIEETSYEIVELVFDTPEAMAVINMSNPTENQLRLQRAVAYCLARSYDVDGTSENGGPSFERVLNELRVEALQPIVEQTGASILVKNLSQSSRGFIALGPRGAVVAHAKHKPHPRLLVAALNMIEILRGRRFIMLLARTYADEAIRKMSHVVDDVRKQVPKANGVISEMAGEESEMRNKDAEKMSNLVQDASNLVIRANSLYGLVLSDPAAYLLDGSTLTKLTGVAEQWFGIDYLRSECQRKMDTMHLLWEHNRVKYPLQFARY